MLHPRQWTLADLERELEAAGACLRWTSFGQNLNWKHNPGRENWWHVVIGPADPKSRTTMDATEMWRHGSAWAPTLDIAIAKALRNYKAWTPPDFGARVEREQAEGKRKLSGEDLLKELGL